MIEKDTLEKASTEVNKAEKKIMEIMGENRPLNIIELAKCVDHCFVRFSFDRPETTKGLQQLSKEFQLFTTAWYGILDIVLDMDEHLAPPLKIASGNVQKNWAKRIFKGMGDIGNVKRLIALAITTVFTNCRLENDTFNFYVNGNDLGLELLEAAQQKQMVQDRFEQAMAYLLSDAQLAPILRGSTYSPDRITVSYHENNLINDHYYAKGNIYANAMIGSDSFTDGSIFNGIPYGNYKMVITALISRSLKHLEMCLAFKHKSRGPSLDPWNIYTTIESKEKLLRMLVSGTGLNESTISSILESFVLDKPKLDQLKMQPGYAPPPLVKFGSGHYVISIMGNLSNPFIYLNRCLSKSFPLDRNIAGSAREDVFKHELYEAFDRNIIKIDHRVNLKENGVDLTDVDAVLYDEKDQLLFLIQIKWMDDWGTDMFQRRNMLTNYSEKVEEWLKTVDRYIEKNGKIKLMDNLGIRNVNDQIIIQKVILGRHFSHFSNYELPEGTIAFNWAGLLQMLSNHPEFRSSLSLLAGHLRTRPLKNALKGLDKQVGQMTVDLGAYKFKTIQSVQSFDQLDDKE
jgi:hypothetical protein